MNQERFMTKSGGKQMPYIKKSRRQLFDKELKILGNRIESGGDLNYCISVLAKIFVERHGEKYKTLENIIGCLECSKLEFYRTNVSPYEDKKIKENGDI